MTPSSLSFLLLAAVVVAMFAVDHTTHAFSVVSTNHHRISCRQHNNGNLVVSMSPASGKSEETSSRTTVSSPVGATSAATTTTESPPRDSLLVVKGRNIEVTDALWQHVNKRIGGTLAKLAGSGAVRECDVILSVAKNPKIKNAHRVEVVTNVKGTTIVCEDESPDMYSSIDMAAAALQRKLAKYKERRIAGWHGGAGVSDDLQAALEMLDEDDATSATLPRATTPVVEVGSELATAEDFVDHDAPTITKVNSFDLTKPVSVEEAVFALDYVDHDFYVFKSSETGKITVVYKRHTGGVGLIEP